MKIDVESKKWVQRISYSKKIILSPKELGSNQIQMVKIKKGDAMDLHHHKKRTEVYYILRGEARLIIDDEEFTAKYGDFFMTKPLQKHKVINESNEDFYLLCFKINFRYNDTFWEKR